ncbi:tether containing UBX domain for GLUT4-like [Chanos chanos]|uniref:Tether containing UBX domain for GLUT4-like n=1 Tax=Chanos chanos TaxID=29144 RepID=A0A6J2WQ26_CHACN|nr:tether containing UBX domain for GLUT4-like [Chanos chanos]
MAPKKRTKRGQSAHKSLEETSGSPKAQETLTPGTSSFVPFSGTGHRLGDTTGQSNNQELNSKPFSSSASRATGPSRPKRIKVSPDSQHPTRSNEDLDVQREAEFLEPVEREPLVYHMDSWETQRSHSGDLTEDFFELTVDDVRKRFAQLQADSRVLEETPLLTAALRETYMVRRMQRYPKVVIRIQFPDRHVLQGFFRPLETVGNLREFVKSHLSNPQLEFYLFTAPKRTRLIDPSTTLFEANLFPTALLYFTSDEKTDCYLKSQWVNSAVSVLEANQAVASCMPRSPTPSSTSLVPEESFPLPAASRVPANQQSTADGQPQPQTKSQAPKAVRGDPSRVPKWLKLPAATAVIRLRSAMSSKLRQQIGD